MYADVVGYAGKTIDEGLAHEAARLSMGHPYMIQLIGYHM